MKKLMENTKIRILIVTVVSVLLLVVIAIASAAFQIGLAEGTEKKETTSVRSDAIGAFAQQTFPQETEAVPPETEAATTEKKDDLLFQSNGDGSCTLVGLGSYEGSVLYVPEKNVKGETVRAIADCALEGCASLTEIYIPATVRQIGSGAFVGCTSLTAFSVAPASTAYTAEDGVLLSRDKTSLICYPAAKAEESFLLRTEIQTVCAYAFDGILHLQTILYTGSTAQFQSITVGAGNSAMQALSVTCNYKPSAA